MDQLEFFRRVIRIFHGSELPYMAYLSEWVARLRLDHEWAQAQAWK